MLTAPMEVIPQKQRSDIAASAGPPEVFEDLYRVKQYIKDHEMWLDFNPRRAPFPEPYQFASMMTGCTWAEGNRTFLGQLAGCNLNCPYCYRECGEHVETRDVTPREYVEAYGRWNEAFPEHKSGVLRISGGEPFLYENWMHALLARPQWNALWIDTNGTIMPCQGMLDLLADNGYLCAAAVNLCFKPGIEGVALDDQLGVAAELVDAGAEVFFYWPAWDGAAPDDVGPMLQHLQKLRDVYQYAPLRLTVIEIKQYETTKARGWVPYPNIPTDEQGQDGALREAFNTRRHAYKGWLDDNYPADVIWTPACTLDLKFGGAPQ